MAFPSASGSTTLAAALSSATTTAAVTLRNLCAQPLDATRLLLFLGFLADKADRLATLAAVPGLGAYAQAQLSNGSLDIATEFTAMQAQITATRTWIGANVPKDGAGNVLERKLDGNGRLVTNTFTPAQTAGLVTVLDALVASIA
jgi:hypothetical protein